MLYERGVRVCVCVCVCERERVLGAFIHLCPVHLEPFVLVITVESCWLHVTSNGI